MESGAGMAEDEWERPLPTAQYAIGQQVLRERDGGRFSPDGSRSRVMFNVWCD